jgi:hypothetical protein
MHSLTLVKLFPKSYDTHKNRTLLHPPSSVHTFTHRSYMIHFNYLHLLTYWNTVKCHLKINQLGLQHHALLWHMGSSLMSGSPNTSLPFCFQPNFLAFPYLPILHYMVLIWSLSLGKGKSPFNVTTAFVELQDTVYCDCTVTTEDFENSVFPDHVITSFTTTAFMNDQSLHPVIQMLETSIFRFWSYC